MDQNKNWVNYKPFDAYGKFKLCSIIRGNANLNYTCENNGLYLFMQSAYRGDLSSIQSTGAISVLLRSNRNSLGSNDGYANAMVIKAVIGDTITAIQNTGAGYTPCMVLYYLGNMYENATLSTYVHAFNVRNTLSITNATNRVLASLISGSESAVEMNNFTTQQYVTDGVHYGCISTINDYSSGTITTTGASGASSLILDLQLQ